jgi:hypothetical protein
MNSDTIILRNSTIAGGVIILAAILVFAFQPSPLLVKIVSDGFPLLLSLTGAYLAFSLFRRQVKNRLGSRIWGAMAIGLLLWAAGEGIWAYYELVLQQDTPFPSVADVLWTLGYLPLIYSIASQYLPLHATVDRPRRILMVAMVSAVAVLAVWLVIMPILTDPEAGTPAEMFFNLAYPFGDLFLIAFATALASAFLGGELMLAWGPITAGIILDSIADLLFSYGSWHGLYYPDGELNFLSAAFDVIYISAYVVWTVGLYRRLSLPEAGSDLYSKSLLPASQARLVDVDMTKWIIRKAQEQEQEQRVSAAEDPLRVYVHAVAGLLDTLIRHAGGGGVETAFDTFFNEIARRTGCDCELHDGNMSWKGAPPSSDCYVTLLDEAIRYAKNVVPTKTIDRKLWDLERHMPSRIVQAAEENRLRMVRWLDEKRG